MNGPLQYRASFDKIDLVAVVLAHKKQFIFENRAKTRVARVGGADNIFALRNAYPCVQRNTPASRLRFGGNLTTIDGQTAEIQVAEKSGL